MDWYSTQQLKVYWVFGENYDFGCELGWYSAWDCDADKFNLPISIML